MRKTLVVRRRGGIIVLPMESICYLENKGRKVVIHTPEGAFDFYGSLSDVMGQLDPRFIKCHRSYALNMDSVESMDDGEITFQDESVIHLGKSTFRRARQAMAEYMEGCRKISHKA